MLQPPHCLLKSQNFSFISGTNQNRFAFLSMKKVHFGKVANRQNTRVIDFDFSDVRPVVQSKKFLWYGKWWKIEAGIKISTAEYLKILNDVLLSLVRRYYYSTKVMLAKNSAPVHEAKLVQILPE